MYDMKCDMACRTSLDIKPEYPATLFFDGTILMENPLFGTFDGIGNQTRTEPSSFLNLILNPESDSIIESNTAQIHPLVLRDVISHLFRRRIPKADP